MKKITNSAGKLIEAKIVEDVTSHLNARYFKI